MIEGWYDVHGLVRIHLRVRDLSPARFIDSLLASFRSAQIDPSQVNLEILDSVKQYDYSNIVRAGSYHYNLDNRTIWDSNGLVKSEPSGKISFYSDWGIDHYTLTLLILIQLARQGFALCHAMGIVVRDRAIIFPAWHSTGKTGLFSFMLHQDNMGLLGDELMIVSKKGEVYKVPFPIRIQHYHASEQLPEVSKAFRKKRNISISRVIGPLYDKLARPGIAALSRVSPGMVEAIRKVAPTRYVTVPLEELVPGQRIPGKAQLKKVIALARGSGESFHVEPCRSSEIIPEMISMLYCGELFSSPNVQRFLQYWLVLSAFGAAESWQGLLSSLEQTLQEALKDVECYRLKIPEGAQIADLGKFVMDMVSS